MCHTRVQKIIVMFFLCTVSLLFMVSKTYSSELVLVETPKVFSQQDEGKSDEIARRAAHLANRRYGDHAGFTYQGVEAGPYDYRAVIQVFDESLTLTLKSSDGRETDSAAIVGELSENTAVHLSDLLFYQWSSFHAYLSSRMGEPPLLVDEIPSSIISKSVLPDMPATLVPTSIAVKENGNLLLGLSMICVELNSSFGIVGLPARSLYESGNYSFANSLAITPGGTIFFKPPVGRALYRLNPGEEEPKKMRTGTDTVGPFIALHDGSVVLIDLQKKQSLRIINGKRQKLDLQSGPYSYVTAAAAGPENTLWVYDAFERRVRVYTPEGSLIDSVMPLVDQSTGTNAMSLAVFSDGSFVLLYSGGVSGSSLRAFARDGVPLWELSTLGAYLEESLPQVAGLAVDQHRGTIHLSDLMGARILKFLDARYGEKKDMESKLDVQIARLTLQQAQSSGDWSPTARKAELYEREGSYEMAKYQWEIVLENDVTDERAVKKLDELEVTILKASARQLRQKTLEILETLGPESARRSYSTTLQMYERILAMKPDDAAVRDDMESLRNLFRGRERGVAETSMRLSDISISVNDLFPSLMQFYRSHPAGYVRVRNTLKQDITDLRATVDIKKYMDFPAETAPVRRLKPGEQVELEIYLLMNEQIFDVQENLPLQARVQLSFSAGENRVEQSQVVQLLLYRRTAITWDDSAKLASFITPHEGIVTEFSHRIAGIASKPDGFRLPDHFVRAVRICNALGAFRIDYIEDPDSPISQVLGDPRVIDTVRFARTTLLIRAGDCDDTTALLGSLLESSGIGTAIMTSPGHVFLAFDTGEPVGNMWMYRTRRLETLEHGGTVWIPVETTALQGGFMTAWLEASELVRKYDGKREIEFLPVELQQQAYPPLPLPASGFRVVEPPPEDINRLHAASLDDMLEDVHGEISANLLAEAASSDRRSSLAALNRTGILHARFGKDTEAARVFLESIQVDQDYIPPYVNLAQLKLLQEDIDGALTILRMAERREPESAQVHLLFARCYSKKGDAGLAARHLKKIEKISPSLAKRYQYLLKNGKTDVHGSGRRAGIADTPIIWYTEE